MPQQAIENYMLGAVLFLVLLLEIMSKNNVSVKAIVGAVMLLLVALILGAVFNTKLYDESLDIYFMGYGTSTISKSVTLIYAAMSAILTRLFYSSYKNN